MQSYYGSAPATKRFEVTLRERELQLAEGVVRAWNGKIVRRGHGQQQEKPFGGAALVDLPDGMKIRRTRSHQRRQAQIGVEPVTNPAEYDFGGLPRTHKGQQRDIALRMAHVKKGTQCLGHVQRRDLLAR